MAISVVCITKADEESGVGVSAKYLCIWPFRRAIKYSTVGPRLAGGFHRQNADGVFVCSSTARLLSRPPVLCAGLVAVLNLGSAVTAHVTILTNVHST